MAKQSVVPVQLSAVTGGQFEAGVNSSEFGMLITIVNQISLGMMWLALFVAWKLVPIVRGNVCESNDFID